MAKVSLNNIANLRNESTAIAAINANSDLTEQAFDDVLSRDGTAPNYMEADLDMNSNPIINLPAATLSHEPVRKAEFDAITADIAAITDNLESSQAYAAEAFSSKVSAETAAADAAESAIEANIALNAAVRFDIPQTKSGDELVQARANMNLGTMALQNNSSVVITGGTITGLPTPSVATDAANKQYVDDTALGFTVHPAVKYATTTVLPNTPTYNNGAKTLTAGSNTTLTVDGSVVGSGERVLVKDQASSFQNGVYSLTAVGSGAAPWVLTRVSDFDTTATGEIKPGAFFAVTNGTLNAGSTWTMTSTVVTIGTDPIVFAQFSTGGTDVWSISGSDINFTTGKVGIGTASPNVSLTVATNDASVTGAAKISNAGTGDASMFFNADGALWAIGLDNSDSNKFKISTDIVSADVGVNTALTIDSGKVGIGTTSPTEQLHVENNQAALTASMVKNTTAGGTIAHRLQGTALKTSILHTNDTQGAVETTTPLLNIDAKNASGSISMRTGATPTQAVNIGSNGDITLGKGGAGSGHVTISGNTNTDLLITDAAVANASWKILPQTGNTTKLFRIQDPIVPADRLTIDGSGRTVIGGGTSASEKLRVTKGANNGTISDAVLIHDDTANGAVSGTGILQRFTYGNVGSESDFGSVGGYGDGTTIGTGIWGAAHTGAPQVLVGNTNLYLKTALKSTLGTDGTGKVITNAHRLNALLWGCDNTGGSDCSTVINTMFDYIKNSMPRGGEIYFPAGRYKIDTGVTMTYPTPASASTEFAVTLSGDGIGATQLLTTAAGGINMIDIHMVDNRHTFHMKDISCITATSGLNNAIYFHTDASHTDFLRNTFARCSFQGLNEGTATRYWKTGLYVNAVCGVSIESCSFLGKNGDLGVDSTGILITGVNTSLTAIFVDVSKCHFHNLRYGIQYNSYSQGLTVSQCNFQPVGYAILANFGSNMAQLNVTDCQIEPTIGGVYCANGTGSDFNQMIAIKGCIFLIGSANGVTTNGVVGVYLGTYSQYSTICGNQFIVTAGTNQTAIYSTGYNSVITGNTINGFTWGVYYDNAGNGAKFSAQSGNNFQSNTFAYSAGPNTGFITIDATIP